jgi:phosphate starvation-inducible PhoH-like protein
LEVTVKGKDPAVRDAVRVFDQMLDIIRSGRPIAPQDVRYAIQALKEHADADLHSIFLDKIPVLSKQQFITPKTAGQKRYIDTIRKNDLVFAIGPAGSGKTYLAMAMAVFALKEQQVSRIILTRPAVEAGESLGYLPGDLYAKVNPYLRPLYDALYDMMEVDRIQRYLDRGIIEVAPLAYMRGRTLNDAFVILDEAQNTTPEQMKMFLTRLGFGSKAVVGGDVTQSDLPNGKASGLNQAAKILKDVKGVGWVELSRGDVVRHELVQRIIDAYQTNGQTAVSES